MDEYNKKIIQSISFFRKFISVFFTLFLNIYILKNENDFELILKYNFVGVIFTYIFCVLLMKIITNKNAKIIYTLSFIELIICIFLLIIFKENIVKIIYLFRMFYDFQQASYNTIRELIVIGANNQKSMSNFSANTYILEAIATIFTPVFSGFIIEKFSYNILFVILSIEALLIIILALKLKNFYVDDKKLNLKEFVIKIKKYPHLKDSYKCMFYRRISWQGVVTNLLPIILFLRVGTELSVGAYNSIFAIFSILSLTWLKYFNNKNIEKKFYIPFAIIIFISSILLVFNSNFTTLIIYYILMNSLGSIIEAESCSMIFKCINIDNLVEYKREHEIIFCTYMLIGQVISYILTYVLYTFYYNVNILSIAISIMMFFIIIACIYLRKVEKFFEAIRD
jgi:YQGE family putative transporter